MSFGRTKTRLRALINRKDFTEELAGEFIIDAITDLERQLRIGPMETIFDKSDWDGVRNALPIPDNYLETIRIFDDEQAYDEVSFDELLRTRETDLIDRRGIYAKVADRWIIKPVPAVGKTIFVHFYGETVRPALDTDSVVWTEACFLATLYKAAELAADFYQMEMDVVGGYRSKANEHIAKIEAQVIDEAWSGRLAIPSPSQADVGEY